MKRTLLALVAVAFGTSVVGCDAGPIGRVPGQTHFASAPPVGAGARHGGVTDDSGGAAPMANGGAQPVTSPRTVEETDLYRLEGNRLYYLNSFRGLMVFDVTNPDQPSLLGRSPIFGDPVDMIVRNGVAVVVVGDWFGQMDNGTPFHGSIVRGLDASDPTHIKVLGEAKLGGWVRDDRVVGDVIYAVSEDYGWFYGWDYWNYQPTPPTVIVSSVSFANKTIQAVSSESFVGYSGVFNVTPNAILLAHNAGTGDYNTPTTTELRYLDISDPAGAIVERGSLVVPGGVEGWGADNGRWNLDFADGKTAHVVGCLGNGYCDWQSGYVLSTVNFANPDLPAVVSTLDIAATGWSAAARFDANRLYLSPDGSWNTNTTPFQVFDLTNPAAPALAGTINIPGSVWNILPAPGSRIFALGGDYNSASEGEAVSLKYLDVTNPASPSLLGNAKFGQGWAWTPAAGTFKAFTMDATKGLVVLPFAGWDDTNQTYNNGLQLIQFDQNSETVAGAAHTRGWVERGIFVGNRLVSLSDLSLSVVDYSDPTAPQVTAELTLARNVIAAQPSANTIAEVSSDWWDNDVSSSEVRVLPLANAEETADSVSALTVNVDGVNARVFQNGSLAYVVTNVRTNVACAGQLGGKCYARAEQVQVVDLSGGTAVLRGKVQLPLDQWGWWGWGWWGFWWDDWYFGPEAVQVQGDALAFRRWEPIYDSNGAYLDANSYLYIVDLKNPDAPSVASTVIQDDPTAWWGNMRVIGQTLYTGHYEWVQLAGPNSQGVAEYFIDAIDISDRAHPVVGAKINVPGLLVGGSDSDPSLLYTIDYRWDQDVAKNDFDVVRVNGSTATLVSTTTLDGWVGSTFVRGNQAYMSAQKYTDPQQGGTGPQVELHALDLTNPAAPVDHVASDQKGWGWLLDVEGDRALVVSGWGPVGVDIYQLTDGQAPQFSQFVRTRGWWVDGAARQGQSIYLASGYWGVQKIDLQ